MLTPGPAPSGWDAQDLAGVQLSTPPDWESYETDAAAYLQYEADLPMPSGDDVRFRYETLTLDLPDGSQSIVTVVGPVSRYEESGQHEVLASVTVGE